MEDLMNCRPPLSVLLKQQMMVSLSLSLCPPPSASRGFNHKGATGSFWWAVAIQLSLCPYPLHLCAVSARAGPRTQPLQAASSQIWRDEAHVATDKPLWSISWMHSKSVERKALKMEACPWCAQQWLCGQRCQRQPSKHQGTWSSRPVSSQH